MSFKVTCHSYSIPRDHVEPTVTISFVLLCAGLEHLLSDWRVLVCNVRNILSFPTFQVETFLSPSLPQSKNEIKCVIHFLIALLPQNYIIHRPKLREQINVVLSHVAASVVCSGKMWERRKRRCCSRSVNVWAWCCGQQTWLTVNMGACLMDACKSVPVPQTANSNWLNSVKINDEINRQDMGRWDWKRSVVD